MVIKWGVNDVIKAFEEAVKVSPLQNGHNQLLQQLKDKAGKQPPLRVPRRK